MKNTKTKRTAKARSGSLERVVRPFQVVIPNKKGDGIAYTVEIEVPCRVENGTEILTPEAMQYIESTQLYHMCWLRDLKSSRSSKAERALYKGTVEGSNPSATTKRPNAEVSEAAGRKD